jgi:hypothetical protein
MNELLFGAGYQTPDLAHLLLNFIYLFVWLLEFNPEPQAS